MTCFFARPAPLQAAMTFMVDDTTDAVDASPGDGTCATAGGKCTLRAAIQEANALAGDDTIDLPPGTYTLTIPGKSEDAATSGDLDVNDAGSAKLTIVGMGSGPNDTVIAMGNDLVGTPLDRVLDVQTDLDVSKVTIANGNPGSGVVGGGIRIHTGTVTLTNVIVSGNTSSSGGGIYTDSTVTLTDVTVQGNTAANAGGGLENASGTLTLNRVTVSGNMATTGGGINDDSGMTLTNVTVNGNTATMRGGGITNNVTATLTNVTISGNRSQAGGASGSNYLSVSDATFNNVIVADSLSGDNCTGGTLTSEANNLDSGATCGFTNLTDLTGRDPLLGPLQDNGGLTFTQALSPGSPAIDAGAGCPSTDQRGLARPRDGNADGVAVCDIGAFEFQPATGTTTTTTTGTTTTTVQACIVRPDFPSISCGLVILSGLVQTDLQPGKVRDGLQKAVGNGTHFSDRAAKTGSSRRKRGLLGKAIASMGKFVAHLQTQKAKQEISGGTRTDLQQKAQALRDAMRALRSSL